MVKYVACGALASLLGFAACTAGPEQSASVAPAQYESPPPMFQNPGTTYQHPPSTYQAPPPTYQNPGGGTNGCLPCVSYVCSVVQNGQTQSFTLVLSPADAASGCVTDNVVFRCDGTFVDTSNQQAATGSWEFSGTTLTLSEGMQSLTCVVGEAPPQPQPGIAGGGAIDAG